MPPIPNDPDHGPDPRLLEMTPRELLGTLNALDINTVACVIQAAYELAELAEQRNPASPGHVEDFLKMGYRELTITDDDPHYQAHKDDFILPEHFQIRPDDHLDDMGD